jgi:hypothetical protein
VAVAELLGQVLGEVADAPGRVLGPGEHALGVELGPEPGHVPRVIVRADCVKAVLKIKAALHAAPRPALTPVLSLGRPGRRAPASTPQPTANQPDSRAMRPVVHGAVLLESPLSRPRPPRLGRPAASLRNRLHRTKTGCPLARVRAPARKSGEQDATLEMRLARSSPTRRGCIRVKRIAQGPSRSGIIPFSSDGGHSDGRPGTM